MKIEDAIKTKHFESEYHRAALNIMYTNNWMKERIAAIMKQFDLSEQQYNVLRILRGQKGKPANLFTIQQRMIHKMSNATRLVEKLRKKGLVERVVCENNRRKVEITITKKGLALLEEMQPTLTASHEKVFEKLSEKEAEKLSQLLDKMRS